MKYFRDMIDHARNGGTMRWTTGNGTVAKLHDLAIEDFFNLAEAAHDQAGRRKCVERKNQSKKILINTLCYFGQKYLPLIAALAFFRNLP